MPCCISPDEYFPVNLTHWNRDKNRRHVADDILKHIFLNEDVRIEIEISPKLVPKGPIDN